MAAEIESLVTTSCPIKVAKCHFLVLTNEDEIHPLYFAYTNNQFPTSPRIKYI